MTFISGRWIITSLMMAAAEPEPGGRAESREASCSMQH